MVGSEIDDLPEDPFGGNTFQFFNEDTILRRVIHDIISDEIILDTFEALGMEGSSQDVMDMENDASKARKIQISTMTPMLMTLAHQIVHVFQAGMMVAYDLDEEDLEEKFGEEQLLRFLLPSMVSILSELVDFGMLKTGNVVWMQ